MTFRILLVDDNPDSTAALKSLLELRGYQVRTLNDSRLAVAAAREFQPHAVVLDFLMPTCHGGDVAWQFWSDPELRKVRLIVYSALPRTEVAPRLPPAGIPILHKPFETEALLTRLAEWARPAAWLA